MLIIDNQFITFNKLNIKTRLVFLNIAYYYFLPLLQYFK